MNKFYIRLAIVLPIALTIVLVGQSTSALSQSASAGKDSGDMDRTRSIMNQMAMSMMTLLPLSLNSAEFEKPDNRGQILTELNKLKELSGGLIEHTKRFEGSYGFIANSMARDLREIQMRFAKGATHEANFLLHQVAENCATCHTKLPDPKHAPRLESFFKNAEIAKLSPFEQVRLKVATRQFEDAVNSWEQIFASWSKPNEIFAMDSLVDYIKVTVRVLGDPRRARLTLEKLSEKVAIPRFLAREISAWLGSLKSLEKTLKPTGNELKRARALLGKASKTMEYPLDRVGLVDYVGASALLNRYLSQPNIRADQRAEAYLLLGHCETLLGRTTWLSQGEFFYESAIRSAPSSKFGSMALDNLEQLILTEYSGSGGTNIPTEVQSNLDELRHLVSKASTK